ncbi:MAG: hypothetical protein RL885_03040 [Planctomycetota bacterium]
MQYRKVFDLTNKVRSFPTPTGGSVTPLAEAAGGSGSFLMTLASWALAFAVIGGIAYLGLHTFYGEGAADSPVAPGARMSGRDLSQMRADDVEAAKDKSHEATLAGGVGRHGYYAIRVFIGSSTRPILSVRSRQSVDEGKLTANQFRHGGISAKTPIRIETVGAATDRETASRRIAGLIQKGSLSRPPLAGGKQGRLGEQWVTVDDWGAIDFSQF